MFALSAQSFAVSARCVRLISHPITSRRCPIFFFFRDWDPSSKRSFPPKFFRKRGAKNKAKSRETRSSFLRGKESWYIFVPLKKKFRSVKLTVTISPRAGTPSSTENKLPRERLWKLERRYVSFFSSRGWRWAWFPFFVFSTIIGLSVSLFSFFREEAIWKKFVSPGGEFFSRTREERRENFFFGLETTRSKRRELRERVCVRSKELLFFSPLSQNVIVRERNDAFLCLSRETVSVWY